MMRFDASFGTYRRVTITGCASLRAMDDVPCGSTQRAQMRTLLLFRRRVVRILRMWTHYE